jgi:hypothetical protein
MEFKPVTICSGDVRYGKASIQRDRLSREGNDFKPVTICTEMYDMEPEAKCFASQQQTEL